MHSLSRFLYGADPLLPLATFAPKPPAPWGPPAIRSGGPPVPERPESVARRRLRAVRRAATRVSEWLESRWEQDWSPLDSAALRLHFELLDRREELRAVVLAEERAQLRAVLEGRTP